MKYPSTADLLKPEATLILDIASLSHAMVTKYPGSFKPPEQGIYIRGALKPLVSLTNLQRESQYKEITAKSALEKLLKTGTLGDIVLNEKQKRYGRRWFSTKPDESLLATGFIAALVDYELALQCPWLDTGIKERRLFQSLTDTGVMLYEDGVFDLLCNHLVSTAVEFIKPENFRMYDIRRTHTSLIIERLCDWRVYEWTRTQEELADGETTGMDANTDGC